MCNNLVTGLRQDDVVAAEGIILLTSFKDKGSYDEAEKVVLKPEISRFYPDEGTDRYLT